MADTHSSAAEEEQLITRAQAGDPAAFSSLVRSHQNRIFGFITYLCGSADEATDLTQDVFIKAWQALPDWRPEAKFSTWLTQIARNTTIDALRRRNTVVFASLDEEDENRQLVETSAGPQDSLINSQDYQQLLLALDTINPNYREILLLRELEGLSYSEIATILEVSEGTVKSRLARARVAALTAFKRQTGESHE